MVIDANQYVLGYYALAAGAVAHQEATRAIRRNMPDPVPVMVLGRLAVDTRAQGINSVRPCLRYGNSCAVHCRDAGVRALVVHALNERASILRVLWFSSVTNAPDDLDASD
ncbi:hypothetical protein [Xylella fastidiosa]|uniref:hypothetical protein n=1 Tax=Xylella fastidiosa TaxID=2371 RepID=UPI002367F651|nr:hypothetical protein [Xylella fastidiosa]WDN62371.1 hypothetical protein LOK86_00015 [Xylella fastidiosa subsp. multiplex]